jgi:CspA family cold shock protein
MQGTIARLTDRGFGFIKPDGEDKDVFFHAKAVVNVAYNDLKEGDVVTFEMEQGPKGPAAGNINRI